MKIALISSLFVLGFAGTASAASITTAGFAPGFYGGTVAVAPEATITSFGTDLFFHGADSRPDSFCAVSSGCATDMEIDFVGVVSNLMFEIGGYNVGDSIVVSAYDAVGALIGTAGSFESNGLVDLSGFGAIGRIFIDDSSTGAGYGYDAFSFDTATVPLPAGAVLLASGLGLLGLKRRKS